jgi:hypothetical protein
LVIALPPVPHVPTPTRPSTLSGVAKMLFFTLPLVVLENTYYKTPDFPELMKTQDTNGKKLHLRVESQPFVLFSFPFFLKCFDALHFLLCFLLFLFTLGRHELFPEK